MKIHRLRFFVHLARITYTSRRACSSRGRASSAFRADLLTSIEWAIYILVVLHNLAQGHGGLVPMPRDVGDICIISRAHYISTWKTRYFGAEAQPRKARALRLHILPSFRIIFMKRESHSLRGIARRLGDYLTSEDRANGQECRSTQ